MRCPHCGTENFTMDGWEDLDHCSSCGKPLAEAARPAADAESGPHTAGQTPDVRGSRDGRGQGAERPRPA